MLSRVLICTMQLLCLYPASYPVPPAFESGYVTVQQDTVQLQWVSASGNLGLWRAGLCNRKDAGSKWLLCCSCDGFAFNVQIAMNLVTGMAWPQVCTYHYQYQQGWPPGHGSD